MINIYKHLRSTTFKEMKASPSLLLRDTGSNVGNIGEQYHILGPEETSDHEFNVKRRYKTAKALIGTSGNYPLGKYVLGSPDTVRFNFRFLAEGQKGVPKVKVPSLLLLLALDAK